MISIVKIIVMFMFCIFICFCTRMIPERASIDNVDEKFITDAVLTVRRNGRRSDYYVNIEGTIKYNWGDNISVHVIFYEFLHNEYKRSFVEFHFDKLCKMVFFDPLIGKAFSNAGVKQCPVPACMLMIPERVTVDYTNPEYVTDLNATVRRYGRKSPYYVNIEAILKHTWGNNASFHVYLYEYLHNEYRPTFVEFHFKHGCDFLHSDPYIGKAVANTGVQCPAPPGKYNLANMTLPCEDFPYTWPFEKAKGTGIDTCCGDKIVMAKVSLYMKFVQKKKNIKKSY